MKLLYEFDLTKTDPEILLEIPFEDIEEMFLSITNRQKRNKTDLYQQKHINGVENSSDRKKELTELNMPIEAHFKENFQIEDPYKVEKRYLVIGVGDCTANLFRASFDPTLWPRNPFFYLEDEPFREKEYYGFIVSRDQGKLKAKIETITFQQGKPVLNGKEIPGLSWMFCSTPLVYRGKIVDGSGMAKNNYDLRHLFGKENGSETINEIYKKFREGGYPAFANAIEAKKDKIIGTGQDVNWYHAGIGIKDDAFLVIHHIGSLLDLANKFYTLGVEDAVLLDSGGSSVVWANWNYNGILAHHWYFRPDRGAIIIFHLKGKQKRI